MDWFWFELVRDKKTTSGQGREEKLLNRRAGGKIRLHPAKIAT